jgi:acid phosphatase type 7
MKRPRPAVTCPTQGMDAPDELLRGLLRGAALALLAAALLLSAPAPGRAQTPTLAATGDVACRPGDPVTPATCQHAATAALVGHLRPTAVAVLGDVQYEDGALPEFMGSFDPTWGAFKSLIRPAIGNHEYHTPGGAGYFDYFNGIGGYAGPAGERGKGWYSYPVGGWHVIVLNSNCHMVSCAAGSEQEQWLRAELARWRSSCTLAYMHHPLFSSGPNRNDPVGHATRPLWQALYAARADVVLAGHDHHYERFAPLTPAGVRDEETGIREIVVGSGGKSLYTFRRRSPASQYRNNTDFGVLSMALRPSGYDWSFISAATRTILDTGSSACHNARPEIRDFTASRREFRVSSGSTALFAARRRLVPRTTTFSYRLSKLATVRLAITALLPGRRSGGRCVAPPRRRLKRGSACTRRILRGVLERSGRPTRINRIVFTGRLGGRALTPGRYEARIGAEANDLTSPPRRLTFRIAR